MSRRTDSGAPLRAMKRDGILPQRPRSRADYDDYYVPLKPLVVLGSRVVLVEEEYVVQYIGCCADTGIGLFFDIASPASLARITRFSESSRCQLTLGQEAIDALSIGGTTARPGRTYVYLKCGTWTRN